MMKTENKKNLINKRLDFCEWDYLLAEASDKRQKMNDFIVAAYCNLRKELTDKQRSIVEMVYYDGLTVTEVANRLGVSIAAVSKAKDRGLIRLGKKFSELMYLGQSSDFISTTKPKGVNNEK